MKRAPRTGAPGVAVGVALSLGVHGIAWWLWPAPPAPRERRSIEVVLAPPPHPLASTPSIVSQPPPEPAPEPVPPPAPGLAPEPASPPPGVAATAGTSAAREPASAARPRAGAGGRGWRARLREREAQHAAAMAEQARKWALAERSEADPRGERGPRPATDARVRRCQARDAGPAFAYRGTREARAYASVLPAGLFPSSYVEQMWELTGSEGRDRWHFALPPEPLPMPLDDPAGHLVIAGRDDARCAVGVDVTPERLFPIRFSHVPVRIVDAQDRVTSSVVDIELFADGTFAWRLVGGDALPFARGALYDHTTVGRNLQEHYVRARVLRDVTRALVRD